MLAERACAKTEFELMMYRDCKYMCVLLDYEAENVAQPLLVVNKTKTAWLICSKLTSGAKRSQESVEIGTGQKDVRG